MSPSLSRPANAITTLVAVLILSTHFVSLVEPSVTAAALPSPASGELDIVKFLSTRDLVVEGRVARIIHAPRRYLGGCLPPATSGARVVAEVHVRVDHVLQGTSLDSIVIVGTPFYFQYQDVALGAHVIAWGYRAPTDNWTVHGSILVVGEGDLLDGPRGMSVFKRELKALGRRPTLKEVKKGLSRLAGVGGAQVLSSARAIALVRVGNEGKFPDRRLAYELSFISWVAGESVAQPRQLDITLPEGCWPAFQAGDSILVPVMSGTVEGVVRLYGCAAPLRVQCGFVPGLGVRLEDLGTVFSARRDEGVQVTRDRTEPR